MNSRTLWPTLALSATLTAVAAAAGSGLVGAASENALLAELAREDHASRTGGTVTRTDLDRIKLVFVELAEGRVVSPEDKTHAALILDHSPMTFRDGKLTAVSPNDYLLGHRLALSATNAGYAPARTLAAVTLDRYLSMTTGCQKFGTNRFINQQTGKEELAPVDRETTDEERARYGVEPLAALLKRSPEQRHPCVTPRDAP